ncbi:MAG: CvpA family protein [Phycisphaerales bacterium]
MPSMLGLMPERQAETVEVAPRVDRRVALAILAAGAFFGMTAWLAGAVPLALMLGVASACAAQGWWRGGGEVAGLLAGTLLAVFFAPWLGPILDKPVAVVLGTKALQTRVFSISVTFVIITLGVAVAASFGTRRLVRSEPLLHRWNHALGAGIGLIEGSILAMCVLWVPLALAPIAGARLASGEEHAPSQAVVDFARQVRESSLGTLAERTSPLHGSELLAMAEDFAIVSRSPKAMAFFTEQPVMKRLKEMPSVVEALERLKQDPELNGRFSQSSAVPAETLFAIMRSDVVLDILDHSPIVSDLRPMLRDIREALRAAKDEAMRGGT